MAKLAKLGLLFLTVGNFLLFVIRDLLSIIPGLLYLNSIINIFLLITMYRIYFRTDTLLDSTFFSIDRVRSIRFAFVYFVSISVAFFIVLALFFLVFAGIATIIVTVVITILNLIMAIVGLILLIFTGNFIDFVPYDFAIDIFQTIIQFSSIYDNFEIANLIITIAIIISFTVSSYFTGKYIEDSSTGFAISIYSHLIIFIIYLQLSLFSLFEITLEALPVASLIIVTPIYSWYVMKWAFNKKEQLDNYELPDVGKWGKALLVIPLTLLIVAGISQSVFSIIDVFSSSIPPYYTTEFVNITFAVIHTIIVIIIGLSWILWTRVGDFPVDLRIFEIEYREELLMKAKEFREME